MASAYNENYYDITPQIQTLAQLCTQAGAIDPALYGQHQVKRGLRDLDGKGVLTGLTEIAEIQSSREENGVSVPCEGRLFYRGISINDIVRGFLRENRYALKRRRICCSLATCRPGSSWKSSRSCWLDTVRCPPILCGISS